MRPLIVSGGPAVGKSTCGRALASNRERGAFIDGDDIRQLIVAGQATLWSGREGERQLALAARNVSALSRNLRSEGFDVVIADFITPASLAVYRAELPDCFVVHLRVSLPAALERAGTRKVYLTGEEFELLHRLIEAPPEADLILDVDRMVIAEQTAALQTAWAAA